MEVEKPRNKGGRPPNPVKPFPPRAAGRIGPIWDEAVALAKTSGQSMTAFVEEAIRREVRRRKLRAARAADTTTEETQP